MKRLLSAATWARISVSAATKSSTTLAGARVLQWGHSSFSLPSTRSWASTSKVPSHF